MKMITSSLGLALDFERVEAGEFQEGREVAANVRVDDVLCQRGESDHSGLSAAGVGGDAANWPIGNDQFVFRVVPFGLGRHRVPEQFEREAAPAGEQVFHLLCDRFFADAVVAQIDVERAPGVSALDRDAVFLFPAWQWIPFLIVTLLNKTAKSTLDSFSRLLGETDSGLEKLKYEFTTMPPRDVIISSTAWVAFYIFATYLFFHLYDDLGFGPVTRYIVLVEGLFCFATGGVIYYHSLRQLWLVNRTVKTVKRYNLFNLDPVYSFSRLTARTGISWVFMLMLNLLLFPFGVALELILFIAVIQVVLALAAFILPLQVVNNRLTAEKQRLLAETQQRVEATLNRLHEHIDKNKLDDVDQINNAISGLRAERDVLEKIPTLPWRTETLTRFLSAIILPILLLLVQIIVEKWLGS
jgi:hypothetical protein